MKLVRYIFLDLIRSRFIMAYFLVMFVFTITFILLEEDPSKVELSMLSLVLLIVPLVSIIFATIHWYNSAEFIEVLLAQPISRIRLFLSEFMALFLALGGACIIGMGLPMLIYAGDEVAMQLVAAGFFLTLIFSALAFWAAVSTRDKARGIGLSLALWLYFALIYDGLILMLMFNLSDYPIDKLVVGLLSLNPVDIARVMVLIKMDASAMLGYSGAVFTEFLGSKAGIIYAYISLLVWAIIPLWLGVRKFSRRDL